MKHLNFIVLNDAYRLRITLDDIEPVELGRAYENLLAPVMAGETAMLKRGTGYTATGEVSGKRAVFNIRDEGVQMAAIGVCMHSRAAQNVWKELYQGGELPDLIAPPAPWVAVRYDVPDTAVPPWLDRIAWHAAWYLVMDRGDE
ncbi:hypothetical protein LH427_13755 [Laribacter hongkongensis]|uniref:hypothetical protein n=1 Tax=Laribacter hongkongensis TaxID=168471 RepID=UPI001EFC3C09|nr:hypothetical protein [Laribacter hongkongensis]MCG9062965.1 hypothetical protein [Laribacter hongkongensis]